MQDAFREGRSLLESLFTQALLIERALCKTKKFYITLIDFWKAFDIVNDGELFEMIRGEFQDEALEEMIRDLYQGHKNIRGSYTCWIREVTARSDIIWIYPWWRHQIETFSALLAFCAGNSPVTGEFPTQRTVTRSFGVSWAWINGWVSNRDAGDLRRHRAHYDVSVMWNRWYVLCWQHNYQYPTRWGNTLKY